MTTEVVGGGILWKNLVRFTLPGFYKLVDAKKLRENEVVLVKYDYRALEAKLRQLFH